MNRLLLLGLCSISGTASAAGWEYATYVDLGFTVAWNAPDGPIISGKDIDVVLDGLKCSKRGINGLLNCVGVNSWELVTISSQGGATTYFFKRPKP